MTEMIVTRGDSNDPTTRERIRKNERAAREAIQLIAKRNRKLDAEEMFENVLNTVGIMAAELVRDGADVGGAGIAQGVRDVIAYHINASLDGVREAEKRGMN